MRRLLRVSGVFLLVSVMAAAAGATPPSISVFTVVDDFEIVQCGDYNVRTNADARVTEKVWFDGNGDAVRVQVKIQVTRSEYYNDVNPDISISQGAKGAGENVTGDLDLVTGEEHWSGNAFRLTVPGIGRVIWDTGTFKLDEDGNPVFHGISMLADGETGLALCEALAL